jgi:ABC-2 type transport system ATP-binding protein
MEPVIRVEGLTKDYKLYQRQPGVWGSLSTFFSREHKLVRAVDNLSFQIGVGRKVAYIGPNGAGKSTTIKILTGIMTPSAGRCEVAGIVPYRDRVRNARNIGVVFGQRTQLWWDLPVLDSFEILRRIYDIPRPVYDKNMQRFRSLLAIDEVASVPVRKLSLGQRMRIEIAVSFLHDPKVVFLDEPTIGLDAVLKEAIRQLVNCMNEEVGTTVVLTSHDIDDIKEICDDVILIDKSRVVFQGALAQLNRLEQRRSVVVDFRQRGGAREAAARVAQQVASVGGVEFEAENRVRIHFQRDSVNFQALVNYLFSHLDVADFYSQEPDLESIIRQIYLGGIGAELTA